MLKKEKKKDENSRNIIPQETKGHYADDKTGKIKNPNFLWNVDIIHIMFNKKVRLK